MTRRSIFRRSRHRRCTRVLSYEQCVSRLCLTEVAFISHNIVPTEVDDPTSIYAADFDGDGDQDVAFASRDGKPGWFENIDGKGTLGNRRLVTDDAYFGSHDLGARPLSVEDLDGDGDSDILSGYWDDRVVWYENVDGLETFSERREVDNFRDANVRAVISMDVDGDGDIDALSASAGNQRIAWYENTNGLGAFGQPRVVTSAADAAAAVFAADVDADDDMDILSASLGDDTIAWYENTDGLGTFGQQRIITRKADGASSVHAADLDGDGDLDVLSASRHDNKIAWYENDDGKGAYTEQQIITTEASSARSVFAVDLDGDLDVDVLSASANGDMIAWHENLDGRGTFGERKVISTEADGAQSVFATDVDGDGDYDVLSASVGNNQVVWYDNRDGKGEFSGPHIVSTKALGARSVSAADVDGDGNMDILSASELDDKIAWYMNKDGKGAFDQQRIVSADADGATAVHMADVDGDGDMDILSTSENDHAITWYENYLLRGTAELLYDLEGDGVGSIALHTQIGGWFFFSTSNRSLWTTDGTTEGTQLLRDFDGIGRSFAVVGDTFFFTASTPTQGMELWQSDGTVDGTILVKDIQPGTAWSEPNNLTSVGGTLFFTSNGGTFERELWKSDGTTEGTVLIKAIPQGVRESFGELTDVNGALYFTVLDPFYDGVSIDDWHGVELWKSDGTTEGTVRVTDFQSPPSGSHVHDLKVSGSILYYRFDSGHWKTDTATGKTEEIQQFDS